MFSLDNGHLFFKSTRGGQHHDPDFAYIHYSNSFRYTKAKSEVLGQNMTKFRKYGVGGGRNGNPGIIFFFFFMNYAYFFILKHHIGYV